MTMHRGSREGTPNKISSALKEAILEAAENAGKRLKPDAESGTVAYLEQIAIQETASFCSLLGKVLPMTIAETGQNEETRVVVKSTIVWPEDKDGNIIRPSWWADDEQKPSWWRDEQKKKSPTV
ncbi:MAG: hypothetical protein WA728_11660 [Xanthobacteraceae bacterium]